jgi:hypothetical protein
MPKPRKTRPSRTSYEDRQLHKQMMEAQRLNQIPKTLRDAILSRPASPVRTSTFEEQ